MAAATRFGLLGAAEITYSALVEPARSVPAAVATAIAARDPARAAAYASKHDIPSVARSYADLIERDDIDAVYIGLHASAHHEWSARALQAGKHVLCEKPLTVSAPQAQELVELAERCGLVLCEAYHYRYHPYFDAIASAAASLGAIERVEAIHKNNVPRRPVYWDRSLGGGATLHLGGYALHCVRSLLGAEPVVEDVAAKVVDGVDVSLDADLSFGAISARIESSMDHQTFDNRVRVVGREGRLEATSFIVPHIGAHYPQFEAMLTVERNGHPIEHHRGSAPSSYQFQLQEFCAAVESDASMSTSGSDPIAQMRVIDELHRAAGIAFG